MLWGFLFDAVTTGASSRRLPEADGRQVPSIYGPSGDDPGA